MSIQLLRRILLTSYGQRNFNSSAKLFFYEINPKAGHPILHDKPPPDKKLGVFGKIREGYKQLREELILFKEEVKEHLFNDPVVIYRKDEVDVVWRFESDPAMLNKWVVTCDKDYNQGYSTATLTMTSNGKGLFSGILDTRLPKDGRIKRTGYCNFRSIPVRKSFKRQAHLNWSQYNCLVMRIRGDGRCYTINLDCRGDFDLLWNDIYHYALYTRGGPYWQYVKIPFSKFFLASKGYIQDKQRSIPLDMISYFGITLADKVNGPFKLEIDYIGLEYDELETEEFAYENYAITNVRF